MVLGYCSRCGELVPIRAGARHDPRFRSRAWFPLPHPGCDGENTPAGEISFAPRGPGN